MLKTERLEGHGESFGHHRQSNFEFWSLTLLIIFAIEVPFLFLVQQTEPPVMENVAVYGKGQWHMRGRGIETYRNEDPSQTHGTVYSLTIFIQKKSVQSANACSIWRNIHLFAEEGSYQNTQLPLHPKYICSLDNLSQQFLKVRNGFFFQKTWIIRFISQTLGPWNIYFFFFWLLSSCTLALSLDAPSLKDQNPKDYEDHASKSHPYQILQGVVLFLWDCGFR